MPIINTHVFCHCRWVNRKDPNGKNLFSGGFLGLDNIGKSGLSMN